jgi:hypothetical protein
MFKLIVLLIKLVFYSSAKLSNDLILENMLLRKENEILKRQIKKRIKFKFFDRIFYAMLYTLRNAIKEKVILIKPETVLRWQRYLIKSFWTFPSFKSKVGRSVTPATIKNIILDMKNNNLYWGYKRIQGELIKLGIQLDTITIKNILKFYRDRGKIKTGKTWSKFIKSHMRSLYAMDFFTVDTILNQRFYVFFLIYCKTREIVRCAITMNPTREFVREQIIEFSDKLKGPVYLIYDNAGEFKINYKSYGIKGVHTSVEAPDMNAFAERFVGSARREMLDHFIIFNEAQLKNILREYTDYYNTKRPHQGIKQRVPKGYKVQKDGTIYSESILFNLNRSYYRKAA